MDQAQNRVRHDPASSADATVRATCGGRLGFRKRATACKVRRGRELQALSVHLLLWRQRGDGRRRDDGEKSGFIEKLVQQAIDNMQILVQAPSSDTRTTHMAKSHLRSNLPLILCGSTPVHPRPGRGSSATVAQQRAICDRPGASRGSRLRLVRHARRPACHRRSWGHAAQQSARGADAVAASPRRAGGSARECPAMLRSAALIRRRGRLAVWISLRCTATSASRPVACRSADCSRADAARRVARTPQTL